MQTKTATALLCLLLGAAYLLPAQKNSAPRDAGVLVVTLGTDTTFIHKFDIRGDSFFSQILSMATGLRLTEGRGAFAPDGSLKSVISAVSTLDSAGNWRQVQETQISTTTDSTIVRILRDGQTTFRNFAGSCILTNNGDAASFQLFPVYGYRAPKRTGDSVVYRHVTPLGARDFVITRTGQNTVRTRSSFMGPITLFLDKKGRLLSVDALGSSLNFTAQVYRNADFEALKKHFAQKQRQTGAKLAVSVRDTARLVQGEQQVTVNYWRPSARGRKVFGGIVPLGRYWRLGANNATEITFAQPVIFENQTLPAGKYTLFALPTEQGWTLMINRKTGIWGTEYDAAADVLRVPLLVEALTAYVEQLTISILPLADGGMLTVDWEKTRLKVAFANANKSPETRIREAAAAFSRHVVASDWDAIAAAYTEDAKIFPPGKNILADRAAIRDYWTTATNVVHHKITPSEIKIIGTEAYDWGVYEGRSVGTDGKEAAWKGKYVIVWKEVMPGDWRMYLDCWNRVD
ncbi:MAG: DUF2911 domain-containing protein [Saprospiraceae bacterium]